MDFISRSALVGVDGKYYGDTQCYVAICIVNNSLPQLLFFCLFVTICRAFISQLNNSNLYLVFTTSFNYKLIFHVRAFNLIPNSWNHVRHDTVINNLQEHFALVNGSFILNTCKEMLIIKSASLA